MKNYTPLSRCFSNYQPVALICITGDLKALAVCLQTLGGGIDIYEMISSFLITSQSCVWCHLAWQIRRGQLETGSDLYLASEMTWTHCVEDDISCNYSLTDALLGIFHDRYSKRETGKSLKYQMPKHPSELTQPWFSTKQLHHGLLDGIFASWLFFQHCQNSLKPPSVLKRIYKPAKGVSNCCLVGLSTRKTISYLSADVNTWRVLTKSLTPAGSEPRRAPSAAPSLGAALLLLLMLFHFVH